MNLSKAAARVEPGYLQFTASRAPWWHYPLAFIVVAPFPALGAFLVPGFITGKPLDFPLAIAIGLGFTVAGVIVVEFFHAKKVLEARKDVLLALDQTAPDVVTWRRILFGIQNAKVLRLSKRRDAMTELIVSRASNMPPHELELDRTIETMAMQPAVLASFPFIIVYGLLRGA